jgi:hypothetical protein
VHDLLLVCSLTCSTVTHALHLGHGLKFWECLQSLSRCRLRSVISIAFVKIALLAHTEDSALATGSRSSNDRRACLV